MTQAEQLTKAYELGHKRAQFEIDKHNQKVPVDDLWQTADQQDILAVVTGDKLDPADEFATLLIDNYENGYYDAEEWENA